MYVRGIICSSVLVLVFCQFCFGRKQHKPKDMSSLSEYCDVPELNARVTYLRNQKGDRIFFDCERGFKRLGSTYSVCDKGTWTHESPICIANRCSRTYSLTNGRVSLGYSGALMKFECTAPYRLVGASVLVCDGQRWNGTTPTCMDPDDRGSETSASKNSFSKTHDDWLNEADYSCIKSKDSVYPPIIANADSFTKWTMSDGLPRLYTLYRCRWGFVGRGESRHMYCQNGKWVGGLPKCIKAVSPTTASSVLGDQPAQRSHVQWLEQSDYTCMGSAKDLHRVVPQPVANGNFVLRYAVAKATPRMYAILKCNHGYKLRNSQDESKYCKEKTWIGPDPACVTDTERTADLSSTCDENNGGCSDVCETGPAQRVTCSCQKGYRLDSDGKTCIDMDECNTDNGGCEQICRNNDGSYVCHCLVGYLLSANGRSCDKAEWTKEEDLVPPLALFHL